MKRSVSITFSFALLLICAAAVVARADFKIKTKTTMAGQSFEGTTYIKRARQRTEQNIATMRTASIMQCDLKRTIQINDAARTYMISPFDTDSSSAADSTTAGSSKARPSTATTTTTQSGPTRRGGVVTFTNNVIDTGERKQMFGLTARHLKTSMITESSPEACNPTKMKIETDGWYVDLQYGIDCQWDRPQSAAMPHRSGKPDCVDQYRFKTNGAVKPGYPLQVTTTMYGEDGQISMTMRTEVLELSNATLEAALFDVPVGYTEAKDAQELYGTPSVAAIGRAVKEMAADAIASNRTEATTVQPSSATGAAMIRGTVAADAPKKAGAVRIGVVMPKAQMTSGGASSTEAAEAVRNTFIGYLNGPTLELVALTARLPAQAVEEAKQSQCDFVLFSSLTQKKGGGGGMFGGALGNIASAAASHIPYGNSTGEAVARSVATTTVYNAATIAHSIKAKDEVTLEYKLQAIDGGAKPLATNTAKAKAKSDGEDVLTPLIEKAAETMVAAVIKK